MRNEGISTQINQPEVGGVGTVNNPRQVECVPSKESGQASYFTSLTFLTSCWKEAGSVWMHAIVRRDRTVMTEFPTMHRLMSQNGSILLICPYKCLLSRVVLYVVGQAGA
jgi:hypothetical protein